MRSRNGLASSCSPLRGGGLQEGSCRQRGFGLGTAGWAVRGIKLPQQIAEHVRQSADGRHFRRAGIEIREERGLDVVGVPDVIERQQSVDGRQFPLDAVVDARRRLEPGGAGGETPRGGGPPSNDAAISRSWPW